MVRDFIKLDCIEKRVVGALLVLIITLFGFYSYFIDQSVKSIVARKDILSEKALLSATLGSLELDYVSSQTQVTSDRAYSLGFDESGDVYFVSKETNVNHLTLNDEN